MYLHQYGAIHQVVGHHLVHPHIHCWRRLISPKWFRPISGFLNYFSPPTTDPLIPPSIHTFGLGIARKQSPSSFPISVHQRSVLLLV